MLALLIYSIVIIVLMLLTFFIFTYNKIVTLRNRVDNQWSQIEILLKKRNDLIPELVITIKPYTKHEKNIQEIASLRNSFEAAAIDAKPKLSQQLSNTLKSAFAISEKYPDLQADKQFLKLQKEIKKVESEIAYARQFYNDTAQIYNVFIKSFPTSVIANIFKSKEKRYFSE